MLSKKLNEIGAIQHGTFTLKSGITSPIYIDLRLLVSHPELLDEIADLLWEKIKNLEFDVICGVPYTALPIATAISIKYGVPMVMRRKEAKGHGTKRLLEGKFEKGQRCLIIEDLITSGTSIFETVEVLENEGLTVTDAVLVLDRQQGGRENLAAKGITAHSLITLSEALEKKEEVRLSYGERAQHCTNPTGKALFELMEEKKTNLSFNPDVTSKAEFLQLVDQVGPEICMLKTHYDVIEDWDEDCIEQLQSLAKKHHFLIFEDRKFADIGNTVRLQYAPIARWADITNAHTVPGPGIIKGLAQVGMPRKRGLLLLAEMSSTGTLAKGAYTAASIEYAKRHKDFVIGFIAMRKLTDDPSFVHITPGVKLQKGTDNLGQQFKTPEYVIGECGSDIIQVGRGIYQADDPRAEAARYRKAGWEAYANTQLVHA